jgi:lactaldehyde dehydrogenase / glycolaldehyde dehydrogenase
MAALAGIGTELSRFVGGRWVSAHGDERAIVDPTSAQTLVSISDATAEDVDEAVAAALAAQRGWGGRPSVERGRLLSALAAELDEAVETLAETLSAESGKPVGQARGEIGIAAEMLRFTAEWARRLQGDVVPSDSRDELITLLRVPVGVVAAICAWNFPVALFARKVGPALLAGNTVVVKPSELTPLTTLAVMRLAERVGFPAGVLNLVCGGRETGRTITRHPDIDLITMTGSRTSGQQILQDAAANLTRVSLELGGKAPAIIAADADLNLAVRAVVEARHFNAGQVCTAAEVVYVDEGVAGAFTERYLAAVAALRVGDPASDPDMGPLASAAQLEKVRMAVDNAVALGASRAAPGGHDFAGRAGYWFAPVVLTDVPTDAAAVSSETFGPVTPIVRVASIEEAIERANASRYGLSAYIYTRDYQTAMRAAQTLECGEVYINRGIGEALQAHHSGHKQSGMGGEDGIYGLLRYTQIRSVYHYYGG